jgi:hypothetical protein
MRQRQARRRHRTPRSSPRTVRPDRESLPAATSAVTRATPASRFALLPPADGRRSCSVRRAGPDRDRHRRCGPCAGRCCLDCSTRPSVARPAGRPVVAVDRPSGPEERATFGASARTAATPSVSGQQDRRGCSHRFAVITDEAFYAHAGPVGRAYRYEFVARLAQGVGAGSPDDAVGGATGALEEVDRLPCGELVQRRAGQRGSVADPLTVAGDRHRAEGSLASAGWPPWS